MGNHKPPVRGSHTKAHRPYEADRATPEEVEARRNQRRRSESVAMDIRLEARRRVASGEFKLFDRPTDLNALAMSALEVEGLRMAEFAEGKRELTEFEAEALEAYRRREARTYGKRVRKTPRAKTQAKAPSGLEAQLAWRKSAITEAEAGVRRAAAKVKASKDGPLGEWLTRDALVRATSDIELRDKGKGKMPMLSGHFSVTGVWARIDSLIEGTFMERIAPGAFREAFRQHHSGEHEIKVLFQHGRDIIGDRPLGKIVRLEEDSTGAAYDVELFDTDYVRELLPGLEAGVYGASFAFSVDREEFDREPGTSADNPEGLPERTVQSVRMHEFGPVTWGAYKEATSGIRGNLCVTDDFRNIEARDQHWRPR